MADLHPKYSRIVCHNQSPQLVEWRRKFPRQKNARAESHTTSNPPDRFFGNQKAPDFTGKTILRVKLFPFWTRMFPMYGIGQSGFLALLWANKRRTKNTRWRLQTRRPSILFVFFGGAGRGAGLVVLRMYFIVWTFPASWTGRGIRGHRLLYY